MLMNALFIYLRQGRFFLLMLLCGGSLFILGCEAPKTGLSRSPDALVIAVKDITPPTSSSAKDGSATITWTPPTNKGLLDNGDEAEVMTYRIAYSKLKNFAAETGKIVNGSSTSTRLSGLEGGGTVYYVRGYAQNNSKKPDSQPSQTISFQVGSSGN